MQLIHPFEVEIAPLDPYRFREALAVDGDVEQWQEFATCLERCKDSLTGRTIWNINSTATGGGVAEMLRSLMAYSRGAGVDARWVAVSGNPAFFRVTKRLHNMLHGEAGDQQGLTAADRAAYDQATKANAAEFLPYVKPHDVVILHDPQTAGMVSPLKDAGATVIWRSHIGTERPNTLVEQAWDFLLEHAQAADARVFSRFAYVPEQLRSAPAAIIAPSIDPFSFKNRALDESTIRAILHKVDLVSSKKGGPSSLPQDHSLGTFKHACQVVRENDPPNFGTPLVVQVSRWDRLKDPIGVMRGFVDHVAAETDAHLVLAGPSVEGVADDPEGGETFEQTVQAWRDIPPAIRGRVHLACLPMHDVAENAVIVNALQRHATIIVQKSLQEGFGLTVTEAMWKGRPTIGSNLGGIRKQIEHERNGLLVEPEDLEQFGDLLCQVLNDPSMARRLGDQAFRDVRENSLHSRHLIRWFNLLETILGTSSPGPA